VSERSVQPAALSSSLTGESSISPTAPPTSMKLRRPLSSNLRRRAHGLQSPCCRNQPTDDDVLLEAAQIVLESRTAASVSTRVVSWNEAADINDSVANDALVMPSSTGCRRAACFHRFQPVVDVERTRAIDLLATQQRGLADRHHLGLPQHLSDDDLDVLVVDLHALQTIDVLDLADEVVRQRRDACSRRMSCGFGSPSAMTSPRSTVSPSNTLSWRHLGISSSYFSASSLVITRRRFPLVSLPKLTVPLFSARMAGSFGLRASNRSPRAQTARDVAVLEDSAGCAR